MIGNGRLHDDGPVALDHHRVRGGSPLNDQSIGTEITFQRQIRRQSDIPIDERQQIIDANQTVTSVCTRKIEERFVRRSALNGDLIIIRIAIIV